MYPPPLLYGPTPMMPIKFRAGVNLGILKKSFDVFSFLMILGFKSTRYTGTKNTTKKYTKIIPYPAMMNVTN